MAPDYDGNTARMDCLLHAIKTAHNLGLKLMLKPHIDAYFELIDTLDPSIADLLTA